MGLIDLILNLAGLLFWLNWRAVHFPLLTTALSRSLLGTLRKAEAGQGRHWRYLAGLAALLSLRALIYSQIGSAVHWTPHLQLGAISLPFRSDSLGRMLLFSWLSFGLFLATFYFWLLLLSVINRSVPDTDPLQKLVRLHLGLVERWPVLAKLLGPPIIASVVWILLSGFLSKLGIVPPAASFGHTVQQALVIGLAAFLSWKYLIIGILLLYLLSSYVFLGNSPTWAFINMTARHLLTPLRWLPLRLGRLDATPLAGLVLVCLAGEFAPRWLTELYQNLPL